MTTGDIDTLQHYVAHTVLPRMGIAGRDIVLEPAKLGARNRIFFLTLDAGRSFVLKGFTSKTRLQNTVLAGRFLLRYGIAAPKILFFDASTKTFSRLGHFFLCEERIQGAPALEAGGDLETIEAIAAFFSRLHSLRSSRWGSLRSPRRFGFGAYMLRKIRERVQILNSSGTRFSPAVGSNIIRWFEERQAACAAVGDFSLCHGDVNPANIMITPDRGVVLIDTEALKYLPFPIEYFRLQFFLCRDDAAAQEHFQRHYFADAHPARRAEMERYSLLYKAFVLLEFAWYYNKKLKQRDALDEDARSRAAVHKQAALEELACVLCL